MNNTQANDLLRKTQPTDIDLDQYHWMERKDFDKSIRALYEERTWWLFIMGEDWFNRQAERFFQDWTESGTLPPFYDNDYYVDRTCWEMDNPKYVGKTSPVQSR